MKADTKAQILAHNVKSWSGYTAFLPLTLLALHSFFKLFDYNYLLEMTWLSKPVMDNIPMPYFSEIEKYPKMHIKAQMIMNSKSNLEQKE